MRVAAALVLSAALAVMAMSCGGGSSGASDACTDTGCAGACAPGNSLGVGKACTPGGGECNGSDAPFCTVDFETTDLAFCTRTCADSSQCGEGATCTGQGGPMGCVPNECLSPGELDAGVGADAAPAAARAGT